MFKKIIIVLIIVTFGVGCSNIENPNVTSELVDTDYTILGSGSFSDITSTSSLFSTFVPGVYNSSFESPDSDYIIATELSFMAKKLYKVKINLYNSENQLINDYYINKNCDKKNKKLLANVLQELTDYTQTLITNQNINDIEFVDNWSSNLFKQSIESTINIAKANCTIQANIDPNKKTRVMSDKLSSMKDGSYSIVTPKDSENFYEAISIQITDGKLVSLRFSRRNQFAVFNDTFEEKYSSEISKEQCRNDLAGLYKYVPEIMDKQGVEDIDVISGPTWSYNKLRNAYIKVITEAIDQSK